jgi:hypothetical protein
VRIGQVAAEVAAQRENVVPGGNQSPIPLNTVSLDGCGIELSAHHRSPQEGHLVIAMDIDG